MIAYININNYHKFSGFPYIKHKENYEISRRVLRSRAYTHFPKTHLLALYLCVFMCILKLEKFHDFALRRATAFSCFHAKNALKA